MEWDPQQYGRYADERARPFLDLVARIGAAAPRRVVDLGCGTGELTASLAERWPGAEVDGIDSSAEMIAQAPAGPRLRFTRATAEDWTMPADTDVLLSNALLQWVPTHRELLRALGSAAARRRLAGVPGARQLRRAVARRDARAGRVRTLVRSARRRAARR